MASHAAVPRRIEQAVSAALRNEELMRQLEESLDAEGRGDNGTSLKELQERRRAAHTA